MGDFTVLIVEKVESENKRRDVFQPIGNPKHWVYINGGKGYTVRDQQREDVAGPRKKNKKVEQPLAESEKENYSQCCCDVTKPQNLVWVNTYIVYSCQGLRDYQGNTDDPFGTSVFGEQQDQEDGGNS